MVYLLLHQKKMLDINTTKRNLFINLIENHSQDESFDIFNKFNGLFIRYAKKKDMYKFGILWHAKKCKEYLIKIQKNVNIKSNILFVVFDVDTASLIEISINTISNGNFTQDEINMFYHGLNESMIKQNIINNIKLKKIVLDKITKSDIRIHSDMTIEI